MATQTQVRAHQRQGRSVTAHRRTTRGAHASVHAAELRARLEHRTERRQQWARRLLGPAVAVGAFARGTLKINPHHALACADDPDGEKGCSLAGCHRRFTPASNRQSYCCDKHRRKATDYAETRKRGLAAEYASETEWNGPRGVHNIELGAMVDDRNADLRSKHSEPGARVNGLNVGETGGTLDQFGNIAVRYPTPQRAHMARGELDGWRADTWQREQSATLAWWRRVGNPFTAEGMEKAAYHRVWRKRFLRGKDISSRLKSGIRLDV